MKQTHQSSSRAGGKDGKYLDTLCPLLLVKGHLEFSAGGSLSFHKSYKAFLKTFFFSTSLAIFSHSCCQMLLCICWIYVVLKQPISKVIK